MSAIPTLPEGIQPTDLALLHHALGISDGRHPDRAPYRSHFVAGPGHADLPGLARLVEAGLMMRRDCAVPICGELYVVTEAGTALALATRPRRQPATARRRASALRYARYLSLRDAIPGLTFAEFLDRERSLAS